MKAKLATGTLLLLSLFVVLTLTERTSQRQVEATGPGGPAPARLIGTVDPRNLKGSPRSMISKRFFHPGGDAALATAKARVATLAPGAGMVSRQKNAPTVSSPVPGAGFEGISFNDTFCGCLPPDGAFAAGPNHLIGAVNTAYKVWNKSGQLLLGPTDIGLFFLGCNMGGVSDPFVDYDASTDRFVLGILSYDFLYNSAVCIAVSRTSDPTGQWYVYYVPVTASDGSGDLFDFPHLAIGSDAFYVAGNQFTNQAQTYAGPRVFAWNKAQMYAGQSQAAGVHFDIPDTTKDTLWPARGVGVPKVMYFAAVDNNCPCANAHVWKWSDPFGANSFVYQGASPLLAFDQPPSAVQPGGGLITTNDTRNLAAYWSNASGSPTVFGAHTIACNPGTGTVACVHWFQLGNLDGPPVTVAQATIGAAGQFRFYPNLAVNKTGDVTVGFAYSSATEYASVHVYDVGTAVETAPRPGEANVDGSRYGDYAGTTVDSDGCTIWHFEEYAKSGTKWGTWATSVKYTNCSGGPVATPTPTPPPVASATPTPTPTNTPVASATPTPTSTPQPTATPKCPPGQQRRGNC